MLLKPCKDLAESLNSYWSVVTHRTWVLHWVYIGTNIQNVHVYVCLKRAFVSFHFKEETCKATCFSGKNFVQGIKQSCALLDVSDRLRRRDGRKPWFPLPLSPEEAQAWLRKKQHLSLFALQLLNQLQFACKTLQHIHPVSGICSKYCNETLNTPKYWVTVKSARTRRVSGASVCTIQIPQNGSSSATKTGRKIIEYSKSP